MNTKRGQIRAAVSIESWKKFEALRNKTGKSKKDLIELMVVKLHNELFTMNENFDGINKLFRDFEQVLNEKVDAVKREGVTINDSFVTTLDKLSDNKRMLSDISKVLLYIGKEVPRLILTLTHLFNKKHVIKKEMIKNSLEESMNDSNILISRMVEDIKLDPDVLLDKLTR